MIQWTNEAVSLSSHDKEPPDAASNIFTLTLSIVSVFSSLDKKIKVFKSGIKKSCFLKHFDDISFIALL